MKYLLCNDTHLRSSTPEGRRDNFRETQNKKFNFIIQTAIENKVDGIIHAGDMFDSPNPAYNLFHEAVGMLRQLQSNQIAFLTIPGQHDMLMRSGDLSKTAMGCLEKAGLLRVLGKKPIRCGDRLEGTAIYGCPFGFDPEEVAKLAEQEPTITNILVIHAMIGDKPLFPGQDISLASNFLEDYKEFSLIVCGDYHYPFLNESRNGRLIVNCGSMTRLTRDEENYTREPHVYIYQSARRKQFLKKIVLPYESADVVFYEKKEKRRDRPDISELIERLKRSELGVDYMQVLNNYFIENETTEEIQTIIAQALENSNETGI